MTQVRDIDVEVVAHRWGNSVDQAMSARELHHLGLIDVVEVDIHVYRGRVEVRHAKVIKPTSRMWEGRNLLPRGATAVALEEILQALGPDVELMADLKCFTTRAASKIRSAIPDDRRVIASTRSWWVLRAFDDRPRTRTLRSCGNRVQLWLAKHLRGVWTSTGFAVHERHVDSTLVHELSGGGGTVYVWGATTGERCAELRQRGVAGLIVDRPEIVSA